MIIGEINKTPVHYEDGSEVAFEKLKGYEWGPYIEEDDSEEQFKMKFVTIVIIIH